MKRGRLITIGSFDGVHRGHAALLGTAVGEARKRNLKSLALTFRVPPRLVLEKWKNLPAGRQGRATEVSALLSDPIEKERLIRDHGVDEVLLLDFDKKIATLRPFLFFRDVLLRGFNAKGVVVGLDFRFGTDRSAGALELVRWGGEFGIPVWVIPPVRWNRRVVSSTLIRQLLRADQLGQANAYAGHPYLIHGTVVKGRGAGTKLGFPTANLRIAPAKILPRGVFAVAGWVQNGRMKPFQGVCNIGIRPTLLKSSPVSVEVHLFGRPGLLIGKRVFVQLLHRLRKEKRFSSVAALKRAIAADVRRARILLKRSH